MVLVDLRRQLKNQIQANFHPFVDKIQVIPIRIRGTTAIINELIPFFSKGTEEVASWQQDNGELVPHWLLPSEAQGSKFAVVDNASDNDWNMNNGRFNQVPVVG